MPSSTVNICVLALVLLSFQQICQCRPHRSKRGLVKDYFVPDTLVFHSDKFEKGEDGKYHLKKSAHRQDSEVKYISADNAESKNSVVPGVSEVETAKSDSKPTEAVNTETDTIKKELSEKEAEVFSSAIIKDAKEVSEKIDIKEEKAPFAPFTDPPKPDAKDEVALKTDLRTIESEEKDEEKISIGEVPDLASPLVPVPENVRIPILIPIRHISYRTMKIIPIPPADVSDRLPVPYEDDIIGEGAHESESEEVSQPLAEKERGYHLGNPLTSLLSFHSILKNLKEADKEDVEKESKVVDVFGKKFLMQSNVMKYPSSDNSHTFIRFLSMKPLDEVKPIEPKEKEIATEEILKKEVEAEERKSTEIQKEESAAKEKEVIEKEEAIKESEIKTETEKKLVKEADVLKAEETELKIEIEKNVPKEVMLKNVGKEENDKVESAAKEIKSVEESFKVTNMNKMPQSEIEDLDLKLVMKNKEMGIAEKDESQIEIKEIKDTGMKIEESKEEEITKKWNHENKNDYDPMLKTMKVEKTDKKIEAIDIFMKKNEEKKIDIDSRKDVFLVEKKKKEKSTEETEEAKKKKIEKKKKKCKCEEKDSDSDDDVDE